MRRKERMVTEGFSMRPDQMKIIRQIATKEGRYVSSIVRDAVDEWIAKRSQKQEG